MVDGFSARYGDLLYGSYDRVDRIVLNAYHTLCYQPGGFRTWWRRLHGDDEQLDNAHLIRMAGRFARRVRASAAAHGIPVIDCKRGERKHQIAEEYLATHPVERGVFLILVARAIAPVWEVTRSSRGVLCNLAKKRAFVNHYSFHILDPEWGHMTIKMSGHPPFGAQVILNGHEYVAAAARAGGVGYVKEGNCFTRIADPAGLAQIADTLSQPATIGRLTQVCDRWIYTACLCFGLDVDEQERSGFTYGYSVYQAEYSRNLMFTIGAQMDRVFDRIVDRTRSRLDVPILRTLFGAKQPPGRNGTPDLSLKLAAVIETPRFDLTLFKLHFSELDVEGLHQKANTCCASKRSCTTPRRCAAGVSWTTSRGSSTGSLAWSTASPPPWTASTPRSSPTACSTGSRHRSSSGPPASAGSTSTSPASAARSPRSSPSQRHPMDSPSPSSPPRSTR